MTSTILSETIALLSVRGTYLLALAFVGIGALGGNVLGSPISDGVRIAIPSHPFLAMFVTLIGALAYTLGARVATDEYRTGTIVWTRLTTPRPCRTVVGRAVVVGATGAALGAVATGIAVISSRLSGGPPAELVDVAKLTGALAATAGLFAIIGTTVGSIVRHPVPAIAGGIVWFLVLEGVVGGVVRPVARFLPAYAAEAVVGPSTPSLLTPSVGALVFAAYAAVLAGAAIAVARQRDAL